MHYDDPIDNPYPRWVAEESRRLGGLANADTWTDASLEAYYKLVFGRAFQPLPGDYTTTKPRGRIPVSGLVAALAAARGHSLSRSHRSYGGNLSPRGEGRRKPEPRIRPEAPKQMGEVRAKAYGYRGVSREAERAAGERWVCPACGPIGSPFHGDDEQMHCPELECDEVVSAAIHVEEAVGYREQGKRFHSKAKARMEMGRVKAEWGSGITRREFDQLRKLAGRDEMGKAIGLSRASIGNWVGGKGAPKPAAQVKLLELLRTKSAAAGDLPKPKNCSVCGTEFVPVAGEKPRCPSCKTQTRAPRRASTPRAPARGATRRPSRRPPNAGVPSPPEVEVVPSNGNGAAPIVAPGSFVLEAKALVQIAEALEGMSQAQAQRILASVAGFYGIRPALAPSPLALEVR